MIESQNIFTQILRKITTVNSNFTSLKSLNISNYNSYNIIFLSIIPLLFFGCSYSFTGSSVPDHLKSIAIPFCIDRSGSGEPTMADDFTSTLIEQFISDNSLAVTERSKADAMLDCTISSISDAPTVIQGNENVSTRRITIRAKVVYKDFVLKKTVFDKNFSNEGDYSTEGDVPTNRADAIQIAIDRITEDILLAVVSDW
jgi:hypothetical protein